MTDFCFEDYAKEFEENALVRVAVTTSDDDSERVVAEVLNRSGLENDDPAFEELYNFTTPTEEDVPYPKKQHKRKKNILRGFSYRSTCDEGSVESGRSRRSNRSTKSFHTQLSTNSGPQRGVRRTQSYNVSSSGISSNSLVTNSNRRSSSSSLRGLFKSGDKLHEKQKAMTPPRRLSKGLKRMISMTTKETFPEDHSLFEARTDESSEFRSLDDDSDGSVYLDDGSYNNGDDKQQVESSESSVDLDNVAKGPPVFLVDTADNEGSFNASSLHLSLSALSVPEEGESEQY